MLKRDMTTFDRRRGMMERDVTAGARDNPDGILGCGENYDAEPPPTRAARETDRGHRERVRRGDVL